MATITHDTQRPVLLPAGGITTQKLPMVGYTTMSGNNEIYHGSIVFQDADVGPGYVQRASGTLATGDIFAGVAQEHQKVDSSQLADGLKSILVAKNGVWGFPKASITQADAGKPAYATTDGDLQTSSSAGLWIGTISYVDATYVWVDIAPAFQHPSSAAF